MPHEPQEEAGECGGTFWVNTTCVMETMWLAVLHRPPLVSLLTYDHNVPYTCCKSMHFKTNITF